MENFNDYRDKRNAFNELYELVDSHVGEHIDPYAYLNYILEDPSRVYLPAKYVLQEDWRSWVDPRNWFNARRRAGDDAYHQQYQQYNKDNKAYSAYLLGKQHNPDAFSGDEWKWAQDLERGGGPVEPNKAYHQQQGIGNYDVQQAKNLAYQYGKIKPNQGSSGSTSGSSGSTSGSTGPRPHMTMQGLMQHITNLQQQNAELTKQLQDMRDELQKAKGGDSAAQPAASAAPQSWGTQAQSSQWFS